MNAFVTAIAVFVVGLILVVAFIDGLVLVDPHRHPLGELLRAWSRHYTLYAMGIAAVTGALLGHFFWQ